MGKILKRKDKTSIFCPHSFESRYESHLRLRSIELVAASGLIIVGAYIVFI